MSAIQRARKSQKQHLFWVVLKIRDEIILGIPMGPVGPMGFPWEWESLG